MTKITTDAYFGGCPECGDTSGYLNIGREHWFVCDKHKTKWCIGENLFSGWRDETEAEWERNSDKLAGYNKVDPVSPDLSNCPRCNAQTIHYRSSTETATHHPLCRKPGTDELSPLADETVRDVLAYLEAAGYHTESNMKSDDEIPF